MVEAGFRRYVRATGYQQSRQNGWEQLRKILLLVTIRNTGIRFIAQSRSEFVKCSKSALMLSRKVMKILKHTLEKLYSRTTFRFLVVYFFPAGQRLRKPGVHVHTIGIVDGIVCYTCKMGLMCNTHPQLYGTPPRGHRYTF